MTLRELLASLYYTNDLALDIAHQAGIRRDRIRLGSAWYTWGSILEEAENQGQLEALIAAVVAEYPQHAAALRAAAEGQPPLVAPPPVDWKAKPVDEKIIGPNELFPIEFLDVARELAKSVVRIRTNNAFGSGFLIANDLVLTNHHVLPTRDAAAGASIDLDYEQTLVGLAKPGETRATAVTPTHGYASELANDWAVVQIEPSGRPPISLSRDASVAKGDLVFIIQHPGGGPKQIALGTNTVMFVDGARVQYMTDTLPGSSGSPVFDRQCRLVALHHAGGWLTEPGGKTPQLRNEGVVIAKVRDGIKAAGFVLA